MFIIFSVCRACVFVVAILMWFNSTKFVCFYFSMGESQKHAVLTKILAASGVLFSRNKLNGTLEKRAEAWQEICSYANEVGLTDEVVAARVFRMDYVNRWKNAFRVIFPELFLPEYSYKLFIFSFQIKVKREISRRAGSQQRKGVSFDACDDLMFTLYGVDREKLCDLWPDEPFLNSKDPAGAKCVDEIKCDDVQVAPEIVPAVDVDAVVPSGDILLKELREAKIEKIRQQTKLIKIQLEIAAIELTQRRASLPEYRRYP